LGSRGEALAEFFPRAQLNMVDNAKRTGAALEAH
jgi:hypothetical protein